MELWFSENHSPNVRFSIKVDRQLYSAQSDIQRIDVFESREFGKILALDGELALSEKDNFIYSEMITHTVMAVHPLVENVLIIGTGNGGIACELIKYNIVKNIDIVEQDEMLVSAVKEHFKETSYVFDDSRISMIIQDGLKYIRKCENKYDLIIVDSTDPYGPGESYFTKEFYGNCYKALKSDGILVNQHESPFYDRAAKAVQKAHKNIFESFNICKVFQAHIPTFPSGHWLFGFASKKYHPLHDLKSEAWHKLGIKTKYYNIKLHAGAFCLPNYVTELLKDVE